MSACGRPHWLLPGLGNGGWHPADGLPMLVVLVLTQLEACRSEVWMGRGSMLGGGSAEEDRLSPLRLLQSIAERPGCSQPYMVPQVFWGRRAQEGMRQGRPDAPHPADSNWPAAPCSRPQTGTDQCLSSAVMRPCNLVQSTGATSRRTCLACWYMVSLHLYVLVSSCLGEFIGFPVQGQSQQ